MSGSAGGRERAQLRSIAGNCRPLAPMRVRISTDSDTMGCIARIPKGFEGAVTEPVDSSIERILIDNPAPIRELAGEQ